MQQNGKTAVAAAVVAHMSSPTKLSW